MRIMSYLVDGNNVMGQRVGWHRDKALARRRLLDELAQFAREAGARVGVVFDGEPEERFPDGATYRGVEVFYAARGSNADERIKEMVDRARERRTLIVVTSDRALADSVRASGARVVRSGEFRRMMEGPRPAEEAGARKKEVRPDDTTHWLRYFGVGHDDE